MGAAQVSPDVKTVTFFSLVPLHADELRLELTRGVEALGELFDAKGVTELVDVEAPERGPASGCGSCDPEEGQANHVRVRPRPTRLGLDPGPGDGL
jgi:hypothetical protein